jgi:hypothetical protein
MRERVVAFGIVALMVSGLGTPAAGQSPSSSSGRDEEALAAVRAVDPRFARLPDFRDAQRRMAAEFDFAPTLAASWIKVLPTFGELNDSYGSAGAFQVAGWMDRGDRVVEVMLVADCQTSLKTWPPTDPCGYRETWLFEVTGADTVTELSTQVITGP